MKLPSGYKNRVKQIIEAQGYSLLTAWDDEGNVVFETHDVIAWALLEDLYRDPDNDKMKFWNSQVGVVVMDQGDGAIPVIVSENELADNELLIGYFRTSEIEKMMDHYRPSSEKIFAARGASRKAGD